jgi:hypothetical protein
MRECETARRDDGQTRDARQTAPLSRLPHDPLPRPFAIAARLRSSTWFNRPTWLNRGQQHTSTWAHRKSGTAHVVNAWPIWTFAWHLIPRAKLSAGRDIFASLEEHSVDDAGFFLPRWNGEGLCAQPVSADRLVLSGSCRGPHFDAMSWSSVAAMQRSNQNLSKAHVLETHSNRNNKSRIENCDTVCESCGRESSVALLWKSGARVTKWAIRTYNGAGRSFARLSALPRWTPHPHPIQCDGFEPRRPHGGAFDSGAFTVAIIWSTG